MQKLLLSRHKNWVAFEKQYLSLMKPRILAKLGKPRSLIRTRIINYIRSNIDTIIIGDPAKLDLVIRDFDLRRSGGISFSRYIRKNADFRGVLTRIFNYRWFRFNKGAWLGQAVGVKACPYCNSQFVLTLDTEDRALFHYDHYYPKIRYPYLSVSLYNLIPSCSNCNVRKGDHYYKRTALMHPYEESFQRISKFHADESSIIRYLKGTIRNLDDIQVDLRYVSGTSVLNATEKFDTQKDLFLLTGIYDNHKDIVADIYIKAKTYNKTMRDELLRIGRKGIPSLTAADIDRLILGNYTTDIDINKRPLSKFSIDIAREAKLIKK